MPLLRTWATPSALAAHTHLLPPEARHSLQVWKASSQCQLESSAYLLSPVLRFSHGHCRLTSPVVVNLPELGRGPVAGASQRPFSDTWQLFGRFSCRPCCLPYNTGRPLVRGGDLEARCQRTAKATGTGTIAAATRGLVLTPSSTLGSTSLQAPPRREPGTLTTCRGMGGPDAPSSMPMMSAGVRLADASSEGAKSPSLGLVSGQLRSSLSDDRCADEKPVNVSHNSPATVNHNSPANVNPNSAANGNHTCAPPSANSPASIASRITPAAVDPPAVTPTAAPGSAALTRHPLGRAVIVPSPVELERKKALMRRMGPGKLQVIADFDRTLTKSRVNGRAGDSSHSLISQGNRYDDMRQQLFERYYPMEIDPSIPINEKAVLMTEWWERCHALLIEGGITHGDLKSSVNKANLAMREGCLRFFELCDAKGVPVLIFSAGLADIIEEIFRQKMDRIFGNLRVVSNRMVFDDTGKLTGFQGKLIHVLNKNEHALEMAGPLHDEAGNVIDDLPHEEGVKVDQGGEEVVRGRSNVLLVGDHLGDLGMSDGVKYTERITVGFLNSNVEKNLDLYARSFDVVILDDGPFDYINDLLEYVLG